MTSAMTEMDSTGCENGVLPMAIFHEVVSIIKHHQHDRNCLKSLAKQFTRYVYK